MADTRPGAAMLSTVRQFAERLRPAAAGTDAELLHRFAAGDEDAFAALVRRHGPMVFGVCRRIAPTHHDAEDAFQAAFLVLAAKPGAVRPAGRVGAFLHGVAVKTALKTRRRPVGPAVPDVAAADVRHSRTYGADELEALHAELARLPDQYRLPLVFCHLEGRSRRDAATMLGWPEGTVSGRLSRGLKLLGDRLRRRGVGLPAVGLTLLVPGELVASTARVGKLVAAGAAPLPAHLIPLARGVLPMLPLRTASLLVVGLVAGAAGLTALPAGDPPAPPPQLTPKPGPRWVEVAKLTRPEPPERVAFGPKGVAIAERGGLLHWKAEFGGEPDDVFTPELKLAEQELKIKLESPLKSWDRLLFSVDGRHLYGISNNGGLLWRCNGADLSGSAGSGGGNANGGDYHDISPDGMIWIDLIDYRSKKCVVFRHNNYVGVTGPGHELVEFGSDAKRAVMSPDTGHLAVALADNSVQMVIRTGMGRNAAVPADGRRRPWSQGVSKGVALPVEGGPATDLVFSPDSDRLAVVEPGGTVALFFHSTAAKLHTFAGHAGGTASVSFHPDGGTLATAGADKLVRLWDVATGKPGPVLRGHTDAVTAAAFSPDGRRLVSGSADKTVRVWELRR